MHIQYSCLNTDVCSSSFFSSPVASVKKENVREGNLTVIVYRGGGRTTLTSSHLVCTVYSGQDSMLMGSASQLYISRCKRKSSLLRCKTPFDILSLTVCVRPKCAHSSIYVQNICVSDHLFVFCSVVSCRIVSARLAVGVCIHVCSGVQHPWPASIGKSPLPPHCLLGHGVSVFGLSLPVGALCPDVLVMQL